MICPTHVKVRGIRIDVDTGQPSGHGHEDGIVGVERLQSLDQVELQQLCEEGGVGLQAVENDWQ